MNNIIEIRELYKSFGEVRAVDGFSFSVKQGELFAFLGVNGAGKSTTINIMCGQLSKDSGSIAIAGKSIDGDATGIKRELGVVFQGSVLDPQLTVQDNLESRAALYGIFGRELRERLGELLDMLDLSELMRRQVGRLSGGQRRRIDVARALLHRPRILVLDEPTTGLDPQTRKMLWSVISELRKRDGMTVFLTTHYMEEAADADHVVILDAGKKVAEGTPLELKNRYTGDFITLYGADAKAVNSIGQPYERVGDAYRISVPDTRTAAALIREYPNLFTDFEVTKGQMDDVFLAATGKKLDERDEK